jgi:hypothetical protein
LQKYNFPVAASNVMLMFIFQSVLERIWFENFSVMVWTTGCGLFLVCEGGGDLPHNMYRVLCLLR